MIAVSWPAAARLQPLVVEVDPDMARLAAQDLMEESP